MTEVLTHRQEYDRRKAERERARQEVREEILGHLATLPDDAFQGLRRFERAEPAQAERERRRHLADVRHERTGVARQLASCPPVVKADPKLKGAEMVAAIQAELEAEAALSQVTGRLEAVDASIAHWDAAGDEHLREWSDRALAFYLAERSDLLREEIKRRREVTK